MANDTPAVVKSYQFQINKGYTASGNLLVDVQNIFYNLKNYLCTLTAHAATVVMSSNSIVAGAADYYIAPASIIAADAGTAHSWVVLKFATLGNMQLLIDHNNSSTYIASPFQLASLGLQAAIRQQHPRQQTKKQ